LRLSLWLATAGLVSPTLAIYTVSALGPPVITSSDSSYYVR
jgi:hypothetical protein